MTKRILIVEHEGALALEMAAVLHADGFSTSIVPSAGDAFREMEERRPDLLFVRAELPDQNGFSLCARVRRSADLRSIPIVLASTDSAPEALRQHAAHPSFAANAYLLAPYGMDDLRAAVHGLLPPDAVSPEEVVAEQAPEAAAQGTAASSEDVDLGASLQEDLGDAPHATGFPEASSPPTPPKLPRRERRSALTDEDKSFLERVFGTIADRKSELLVEARSPRKSRVGRDLINTPEGKLQLLRDELRSREAQIARLSEVWAIRERELSQSDDRLHEKEVEIQGLKMKAEDLVSRLAEARGLFLRKEREHGQAVDEMLQRQFAQEKELIEVVAGKEKELDALRRELSNRETESAEQTAALEALAKNRDEKVAERDFAAAEGIRREGELLRVLAGLEVSVALLEQAAAKAADDRERRVTESAGREATERRSLLADLHRALRAGASLDQDLRAARATLEEAVSRSADREVEIAAVLAEADAERALLEEAVTALEIELHETDRLAESLRLQRDGVDQALRMRLEERDHRVAGLEEELAALREMLERREEELAGELAARVEQIGGLEGELEVLRSERQELEAELRAELAHARAEQESLRVDLAAAASERDAARAEVAARFVELEGVSEERDAFRSDLERTSSSLEATNAELEAIRAELSAERARREEVAATLGEARDALAARDQELEEARSVISDREDELATVRSSVAERETQITAELAEAHARAADAEGTVVALQSELAAKEERWVADLNERSEAIGELEGKLHAAEAEARRADEEGRRALGAKVESLRAAELKVQQLEAELTQAERAHGLEVAALRAQHGEVAREADSLRSATAGLTEKLDEAEALRAQAEREWRASAARKDARLTELSSQMAADRDAFRKREEELRRQLEELQATAEAARNEAAREIEVRDRSVQELTVQARTGARKVQELEQALAGTAADKARSEGELQEKVAQLEAKVAEATARVQAAARGKREADARGAREFEDLAARHRAELERRDQQRSIEVSRLQSALQEKTKSLKVAELELARIKARLVREGAPNVAVAVPRPQTPKPEETAVEIEVEVEKA